MHDSRFPGGRCPEVKSGHPFPRSTCFPEADQFPPPSCDGAPPRGSAASPAAVSRDVKVTCSRLPVVCGCLQGAPLPPVSNSRTFSPHPGPLVLQPGPRSPAFRPTVSLSRTLPSLGSCHIVPLSMSVGWVAAPSHELKQRKRGCQLCVVFGGCLFVSFARCCEGLGVSVRLAELALH